MRTAIGFPQATFGALGGSAAFDPAFPLTNLLDLINIRRVSRAAAAGDLTWNMALPGAPTIQLITLLHLNPQPGATADVTVWSSLPMDPAANPSGVAYDGTVTISGPTQPLLLAAPIAAAGVSFYLRGNGAVSWEIGGVATSAAYLWPNVDFGMQRGFTMRSQRVAQAGGVDAVMGQWSPRIASGARNVVDHAEAETTWLDFQAAQGLGRPFVYVRDIDDPTTWLREAYLAKNKPLQNTVSGIASKVQFSFEEHLG